jgi:hypothetical protein
MMMPSCVSADQPKQVRVVRFPMLASSKQCCRFVSFSKGSRRKMRVAVSSIGLNYEF